MEPGGQVVGSVLRLWRYPVKSVRGQQVATAAADLRGLIGDRLFAVRDAEGKFGSGKNTRRFRRMDGLLDFAAADPGDPVRREDCAPVLITPDGARLPVPSGQADAAVRARLGRQDVTVAAEENVPHHDAAALHLVSAATLDWFVGTLEDVPADERRLRPNLVVAVPGAGAFVEDGWVGRRLRVGMAGAGLVVEVQGLTERCVMTNADHDDLPYSSRPLKLLAGRDLMLGVNVKVVRAGRVSVGDQLVLLDDTDTNTDADTEVPDGAGAVDTVDTAS